VRITYLTNYDSYSCKLVIVVVTRHTTNTDCSSDEDMKNLFINVLYTSISFLFSILIDDMGRDDNE